MQTMSLIVSERSAEKVCYGMIGTASITAHECPRRDRIYLTLKDPNVHKLGYSTWRSLAAHGSYVEARGWEDSRPPCY